MAEIFKEFITTFLAGSAGTLKAYSNIKSVTCLKFPSLLYVSAFVIMSKCNYT